MMRSKRLPLLFSLLLFVWTTGMAAAQGASIAVLAVVIKRDVPLYRTPNGDVVQTLARGTLVTAIGQDADGLWIRVEVDNLAEGWIEAAQLIVVGAEVLPTVTPNSSTAQDDLVKTAAAKVTATRPGASSTAVKAASGKDANSPPTTMSAAEDGPMATVNSGSARLNVRSGPGTSYAIVAKAETGDRLVVQARDAGAAWLKIQLDEDDDAFGWVSAQYVQFDGDVTDLPISNAVAD